VGIAVCPESAIALNATPTMAMADFRARGVLFMAQV
jgi:hypothetical protein